MRLPVWGLVLWVSVATPLNAAQFAISMAKDTWPSGQRIEFILIAMGLGQDPSTDALSDHVTCELNSGRRNMTVTARRISEDESSGTVNSGSGGTDYRVRYGFSLPQSFKGEVQMRIVNVIVPSIRFTVGLPEDTPTGQTRYPTLDSLSTLYQPYLGNIAAHEPMYFLVGTDPEKSKFQISFKYRFFNPESDMADRHPWIKGFHFGYTQTSFWNLQSSSAPFDDASYKPELFWNSKNFLSTGSLVKGLFLQAGGQHESNGRGGDDSRSTNYLYVQPIFIFFSETNRYGLQVAPKIWTYVNNDNATNPDLDSYRGYFDLEIKFGRLDSFVLGSSFRWASEGASIQLDFTYPLHRFLFNTLDIYLQAQYVDALAESLIDYKDRTHAFRLGISIVR